MATSGETPHSNTRLHTAARALADSRSLLDRTFVTMGEQLMGCVRLLTEITLAQRSIPDQLSGPEFLAATAALEEIRETGRQLMVSGPDCNDDLQQVGKSIAALADPIATLRRTISTIQLISLTAKIVAAGTRNTPPGFGSFATEMLDLGREAEIEIDAFVKSYEQLQTCLKASRQAGETFRRRHGATMAHIIEQIEEHIAVIGHHRTRAESKAQAYEEANRRITGRISNAVAAIQVGDITRQRLEHVELMLDLLKEQPAGEESATARMLARLGSDQIDAASADFEREIKGLVAALRDLGTDATAMLRENSSDAEDLLSASGAALGTVLRDMQEMEALLRDFDEMRAGLESAARDFAQSIDTMVAHLDTVGNIEQEIHRLSLNAAVQCSQLGTDGRALLVVAQDFRALAADTAGAARFIMARLADAQEQKTALAIEGEELPDGDTALLGELAMKVVAQIGTVMEHLRICVGTIVETGPRAAHLLESAGLSAKRHCNAATEWHGVQQVIASLVPDPGSEECFDREIFDDLRKHYTMDSEREVHDRIVGTMPENPLAPLEANAIDDIESVLF